MEINVTSKTSDEDSIKCCFYSSNNSDDGLFWENLCEKMNQTVERLSIGYIWHRDEFKVHIPLSKTICDDDPVHLESTTCFGDNIEDEWFIVYLVLELTKQCPNVIAQVNDSDGDFLLIEAAEYLPSWANPESTGNRVFIYNNKIHFITKNHETGLSLKDALNILCNDSEITIASPEIQEAIQNRVSGYPGQIKECLHRTVVQLPVDIAALLTIKPSLIAPIVTTYCHHDVIDAKSCKNIDYKNCVDVEVKFTKMLYAMLMHSKPINLMKQFNTNDKKSLLGLKITCGYQIITHNSSGNLFSSKEYNKFFESLKENGYFRNYMEGSQPHKQLLEKAQDYFVHMECPINSFVSNSISDVMGTDEFSKAKENLKSSNGTDFVEDNDNWLTIHPEQLNDLLDKRYGKKSKFENKDVVNSQTITSKLTDFLKQTSDFEGIEQREEEKDIIEFDHEEFVNSIEKMLNLLSSGNDNVENSDSDFEEESDDMQDELSTAVDNELAGKLFANGESKGNEFLQNILKSMKEEEGSSGPSSNLLNTIGIRKSDLLDSDDEIN